MKLRLIGAAVALMIATTAKAGEMDRDAATVAKKTPAAVNANAANVQASEMDREAPSQAWRGHGYGGYRGGYGGYRGGYGGYRGGIYVGFGGGYGGYYGGYRGGYYGGYAYRPWGGYYRPYSVYRPYYYAPPITVGVSTPLLNVGYSSYPSYAPAYPYYY